jgi:hypothetical protein
MDPIAGDKATGEALLHGYLWSPAHTHPIEKLDFAIRVSRRTCPIIFKDSPGCGICRAATREKGAAWPSTRPALLAAHGEQRSERAWRADLWGRRILFCTAYAPYILSRKDLVYRSAVLNTLARGRAISTAPPTGHRPACRGSPPGPG